jgi:hypothetical protein
VGRPVTVGRTETNALRKRGAITAVFYQPGVVDAQHFADPFAAARSRFHRLCAGTSCFVTG